MKKAELNSIFQGYHNSNLAAASERLVRGQSYQDLSTIWVTVTRGVIPAKVVSCWMAVWKPMNQKFFGPLFIENCEVGDGYNKAVEMILAHPELSKWKYLLTVEEDNMPPTDGLLKLYESIKKYDVVSGLYWTKGEGGQPMIYGDPSVMPKNFTPQIPKPDSVQECNGLGMGFNLFKLSMFKKMSSPWFKTVQENGQAFTQDLYFFNNAGREGFKFACDNRIKVGHYDHSTGMIW